MDEIGRRVSGANSMSMARWIAGGFGSGFCPVAPGTAGSLAAVGLGIPLMLLSPVALPVAIVLACILGVWAIRDLDAGAADPGWIVIDEFAGQWIAMLPLGWAGFSWVGISWTGISWTGLALSFALFRLFDITKPGPVGWADRRHDAIGIMADDLIAGAIAAAILAVVLWIWPTLG